MKCLKKDKGVPAGKEVYKPRRNFHVHGRTRPPLWVTRPSSKGHT